MPGSWLSKQRFLQETKKHLASPSFVAKMFYKPLSLMQIGDRALYHAQLNCSRYRVEVAAAYLDNRFALRALRRLYRHRLAGRGSVTNSNVGGTILYRTSHSPR